MKKKVYISEPIHEAAIDMLRGHFDVVLGNDPAKMAEEAQGCSGILVRVAKVTAEVMDAIPTLEVVAKHGMGVDNIDVAHATQKGILVVNAPFSNLNAVAEHVAMLILTLSKRTVQMDRLTRESSFAKRSAYQTTELKGSTLGIIGLGKISKLLVRKLAGFEMNVLASDPFVKQEDVGDLPVTMVSAEEIYAQSDFVVVHTSLMPATFHLVGAEQFRAMKKTAYFINAARGPVVDEAALIGALQTGEIAGAGLDVFEQEPPSIDNPLFAMEQVVVSPHNAALSDGALHAMAMDSATGVADRLLGKMPTYPVNPEVLDGAK